MRSLISTLVSLLLLASAAQAGEVYTLRDGEGLRDVVIGADGKLWLFTSANFNPVSEVVVGSDGRFWFGTQGGVTAVDINGNRTNYPTGHTVTSVAAAPYGGVWYALTTPQIGYVDTRGDSTERTAPTSTPFDIAVAADGTVWLTQMYAANAVYRISASGEVTTLTLPVRCYFGRITPAADSTVWITSVESSTIAHLDAGGRLLELVKVPKDATWDVRPIIAADGALWLGEQNGLLRIANGVTTRYALPAPTFCSYSFYRYVPRVQAADGSLWVSRELVSVMSADGPAKCNNVWPTLAESQTLVMRVDPASLVPDHPARRRTLR